MAKISAGIIGASGYTGYELIKILTNHKKVDLAVLNSKNYAGKKVSSLYPDFEGGLKYTDASIEEINKLDVVFLAVPHTKAMELVPKLKCKVIDLSADYRFKDYNEYEKVYKVKHLDIVNNKKSVYGLPELNKNKITKSKIVANPGCYAACCLLSLLPIKDLAGYTVFDAKSGWSGAGKKSAFAEDPSIIKDNLVAYKLTKHRHKYEISQFVGNKISFTPHVIDTFQGMMSTTHILLNSNIDKKDIIEKFKKYYKNQPFVKIVDKIPEIKDVSKTNFCHIGGFETDENNQLVIVAVIDNLLKGASGQAVQNMNIMFGFNETEGL